MQHMPRLGVSWIMSMATLYKPNYDSLCSPCLGGNSRRVITREVGSFIANPEPAQFQKSITKCKMPGCQMPDPPLRSASSLCKSSCSKQTLNPSQEMTPYLTPIPASLECWILLD